MSLICLNGICWTEGCFPYGNANEEDVLNFAMFGMGSSIWECVGIKINYHLLTSIYVTSILSYTVLEDDANDEK